MESSEIFSCSKVSNGLWVSEQLSVLFMWLNEANDVPVGEGSHANEAASQVTTQHQAQEDGKGAWGCEPVALEWNAATMQEHQSALQSSKNWEDVHEWVAECLGLLTYSDGSYGHFITFSTNINYSFFLFPKTDKQENEIKIDSEVFFGSRVEKQKWI